MKKFIPLGDRLLVQLDAIEKVSDGGVILPDTTTREKPIEGNALALGDAISANIKQGDRIVFSKYAGTDLILNDETFLILKECDVLGVLKDDK